MSRLRSFAPAIVWAAVVLWLGSLPSLTPPIELPLDKLGHFGMFAVLGALLAFGAWRAGLPRSMPLLLGAGVAVAALDEFNQVSVPGRQAELTDLLADALGCAAGLYLGYRRLNRRREQPLNPSDAGPGGTG